MFITRKIVLSPIKKTTTTATVAYLENKNKQAKQKPATNRQQSKELLNVDVVV